MPGGRLSAACVLLVVVGGYVDVRLTGQVGDITGITLLVVATLAALLAAPGDRSLPVITAPLAFMAAVLTAGQLTVAHQSDWRREQAMMVYNSLGRNARWIALATGVSLLVALIRVLGSWVGRRRPARTAG